MALAGPLAGIPGVPAEQLYEHMRHNELMSMAHMDTCDAGGPGAGGGEAAYICVVVASRQDLASLSPDLKLFQEL